MFFKKKARPKPKQGLFFGTMKLYENKYQLVFEVTEVDSKLINDRPYSKIEVNEVSGTPAGFEKDAISLVPKWMPTKDINWKEEAHD